MAKIKFLPPSPKAGTIEHVPVSVANTLVASGFAEHVPYNGFRERLAEESNINRSAARAGAVAPEFHAVPVWGVKTLQHSGKTVIEKRFGTELVSYAEPPADCPPAVVRAFESLTGKPDQSAVDLAAREKAVTDQAIYAEKIKFAKRW